ncbi:MAG: 2Fe-2S iron-sulfur cluster-binding protein [Pseudomonadota bacterium]|nr:2Fe-2S iron-sulfur cluster-binding protein [Pseudomonadota bacterium]
MSENKTFTLDAKPIEFQDGDTIMDAALRAGAYIPHLCHNPAFEPHGSCRVCIVGVNGRRVSACTQPATEGLAVENNAEAINQERRALLQMLFVEGNHVCPGCEKSGACQLQAIAYYVGMLDPHFTHFFPRRSVDASHAEVAIDFNRCILCELCVRASRDVDRKNLFSISGRGIGSHLVVNSPTGKLGDSDFSVNDKAAQVCPVGAILHKHRGYDRPIGERLYDRQPISVVGDVAEQDGKDHG